MAGWCLRALRCKGAPLDRLLIAYQLPRELTSVHRAGTLGSLSGMGLGSGRLIRQDSLGLVETVREAKLRTLFQYLGVDLWEERRGVLGLGGGLSGGLSADRLRLGCDRGRLL